MNYKKIVLEYRAKNGISQREMDERMGWGAMRTQKIELEKPMHKVTEVKIRNVLEQHGVINREDI